MTTYPAYTAEALERRLDALRRIRVIDDWRYNTELHSYRIYQGSTMVIELFSLKAVWIFLEGVRLTIEHYAE